MNYYKEVKILDRRLSNRYKKCKLLSDSETEYSLLSTRDPVEIPRSSGDILHTVKTNESFRLDILAHKYYNNALLWWVIAEANGIYDPFQEIPVGTQLRIPAYTTVCLLGGNFYE